MKTLPILVISFTVVLLNFARQIKAYSSPENRYFYQWQSLDGISVILTISTISISLFLIYLIVRKQLPNLTRLAKHCFLLIFFSGLFSFVACFINNRPRLFELLWLLAFAVTGYSYAKQNNKFVKLVKNSCLIISPLVLILFIQLATWEPWDQGLEKLPPAIKSKEEKTPVFFFVFDEWSYKRSYNEQQLNSNFQALKELSNQSNVYHKAYAAHANTEVSLPSMLYQRPDSFVQKGNSTYWIKGSEYKRSDEEQHIFKTAEQYDYNTALYGFYLPYRKILGSKINYVVSYTHDASAQDLLGKMKLNLIRNIPLLTDSISDELYQRIYVPFVSRTWFESTTQLIQDSLHALKNAASNSFYFFHLPIPHPPFVFNSDGSYRGPVQRDRLSTRGTIEDYNRNLRLLDLVIGKIIKTLKENKLFDKALIIMTSDHSWKQEYSVNDLENRHVPLIIKQPFQKSKIDNFDKISNSNLTKIIELTTKTTSKPGPSSTDLQS